MLKTRAWVEICSLVLKPDFFIPCFPNLKEKSYLFLCVKVSALSVLVLLLLMVVFLEVGVVLFVF